MMFDAPVLVMLAPVVAAAFSLAALWARRTRIRRATAWSDETAGVARAAGRLGPWGIGLAAGLGALALAGPRWGQERIVAEARGLNLVLAVDISRSMLAADAAPSRLTRALREARRLVQDLDGDRLGLIAFAGTSYILSPLSVDGSAIMLYLDALDPEVASEGGTALAPAIAQAGDLLRASPDAADRVVVLFTDGEAHDSLGRTLEEARRLAELGIHLIVVAQGGREPVRIPVRDENGGTTAQRDADGSVILTARRDDVLGDVADAAQGTIVAAELPDQAGAVRDLVASFKRAAAAQGRTQRGRPRAWIPITLALLLLTVQTVTRRTAALVGLVLTLAPPGAAWAQGSPPEPTASPRPRSVAQKAWDRGDAVAAALALVRELGARQDDDLAWYNAGAAALASGNGDAARAHLSRAAASLDPDVRFRALYNLGTLALAQAPRDSANRATLLADAERAYREALLLRPRHAPTKWNLELVTRLARGGSSGAPPPNPQPPPSGGGASPPPEPPRGSGAQAEGGGMTQAQADQVLRSIGREELRTRRDRTARTRRAAPAGVKDW